MMGSGGLMKNSRVLSARTGTTTSGFIAPVWRRIASIFRSGISAARRLKTLRVTKPMPSLGKPIEIGNTSSGNGDFAERQRNTTLNFRRTISEWTRRRDMAANQIDQDKIPALSPDVIAIA